jgi:uncharacterized membrane protein YoaK (UPF0700 family)/uncharacterized protein YndB with AHSA1/START domain
VPPDSDDRPSDLVLLALTAVAAAADAVTYLSLDKVFPANMTGNTVLLAVGVAGLEKAKTLHCLVALGGFVAGALVAGLFSAGLPWRPALRRGTALEVAVLGAAFGWWLSLADPTAAAYGLIPLVAFAMGVQSATISRLGVGVSTTYITGTWTRVSSWAASRIRRPVEQPRRHERQALVLVVYFGGALLAGYVQHLSLRLAIAVPFGLLVGTALARMLAPGKAPETVRVERTTTAGIPDVWGRLADACGYAEWVSGTREVRDADATWPRVGARLYHRFGPWPWRARDHTTVLESEPPRRLVLAASARPWGVVRAELTLSPDGSRTCVELSEQMLGGLGARLRLPGYALQRMRNRHSLDRLVDLAEHRE